MKYFINCNFDMLVLANEEYVMPSNGGYSCSYHYKELYRTILFNKDSLHIKLPHNYKIFRIGINNKKLKIEVI